MLGSFPVHLSRSVGSVLGGEIVIITGPVFMADDEINCTFGQIEISGAYLSEEQCFCVVPLAANDGIVDFTIKIKRETAVRTGKSKFRYGN